MKILMSIKTEYANKIFSGEKLFELRKRNLKDEVKTIVVYSSGKTKKVIGEFDIDYIIKDSPDKIWDLEEKGLGISKKSFFDYFKNSNLAFAIKIKAIRKYDTLKELSDFNIEKAPQSFCYLKEDKNER